MERFQLTDISTSDTIHFIGIGGISMSGLAQLMLKQGRHITGSDREKTHITDRLEALGATVYEGQSAEHVKGAGLVVYTAAIHDDNPELAQARADGIRTIDRAEFLGAVMKEYQNAVCVAGTHGKTTTTSMLTYAMLELDTDPTISIGGELDVIGGNFRTGGGRYFVTEACEYTNSFLKFYPTVAVITNIEEDHLDFFSGIDEICKSFGTFAGITKDRGCVIALGGDANIKKALEAHSDLDIKYYGIGGAYDYYAENVVYHTGFGDFDVMRCGEKLCHITLNVPGEHNVLNAVAVIASCDCLGLDVHTAADGINKFKGVHRRFEKMGTLNGATILNDYAHHPTEIRATLKAASAFEKNRVWCVFQPHTYSRTRTLWMDFVNAFDMADELILTDIYAAREQFDGVTCAENLADDILQRSKTKNVRFIKDFSDIAEVLKKELRPNDMVFLMGAGNVIDIAELIL